MLAFVVVCYYFLLFVDIMVPLSAVPKVRFQASSAQFVTMLAFLVNSLSLWTLQYYSMADALFKLWPLCLVSLSRPVCKAIKGPVGKWPVENIANDWQYY